MRESPSYATKYTCAKLRREDGVLEVVLHTDGGPLVWAEAPHRELPLLFAEIAADIDNRAVILTGTGASFLASAELAQSVSHQPGKWDKIYREGTALLRSLLDIAVPVISAINGPARIHAELPLLGDIVLAAETAVFQDAAHFPNGVVPGDGVQFVWPLLLGPNRGRYFLLTGQELTASEALDLGVVSEVLPVDDLSTRAWDLARMVAARHPLVLRYTRIALTRDIKARLMDEVAIGLLLEGSAHAAARTEGGDDFFTSHPPTPPRR
jgi:enoyl-CoA hydratase/carnithine racemase